MEPEWTRIRPGLKQIYLEYSKQNLKDLDLDKEIEESEIVRCIKNNKTRGSDGIVSELIILSMEESAW